MFTQLSRYLNDARTLSQLCQTAEDLGRAHGRAKPASEHFVLAALDLPDGTANEAFKLLAINRTRFIAALDEQRVSALEAVGVAVTQSPTTKAAEDLLPPKGKLYEAEPSGQTLVQRLANSGRVRNGRRLLSADVLLAVSQEVNSSASRAFHKLGISGEELANAASAGIMTSSG